LQLLLLDTLKFLKKKLRFPFSFAVVPLIGCTKALTFEWVWRGCRVDLSRKAASRIASWMSIPAGNSGDSRPAPAGGSKPGQARPHPSSSSFIPGTFQISPFVF
jgi:hypothetical protein